VPKGAVFRYLTFAHHTTLPFSIHYFLRNLVMSRLRAAGIHLTICVVIAAILLALFWFVWYPAPLFRAVGGQEIFLMLLGIDVTLGPLLTLVVFKLGKKTLKFDLAVIALVQVAALTYGVYTLLAGRPVYVAALGSRFDVIQANNVEPHELVTAKITLPWWGPNWVGTRKSTDKEEHERVLFSGLGGASYGNFPQHHVPLESMRETILANAKPISELRIKNIARDGEITAWLAQRGYSDQTAVFQPLKASSERMAVILDATTASVIGILPFKTES
jgi:hypothetical protein